MKVITGLLGLLLLAASCHQQQSAPATTPAADTTATPATMEKKAHKFEASMVANKKDPSCGMPVTAGIEDTVHYKDLVLGFCSKECKDAFVAKPDSFKLTLK